MSNFDENREVIINDEKKCFSKIVYYCANYCYGRETYMPGVFAKFVENNINYIDYEVIKKIIDEIGDGTFGRWSASDHIINIWINLKDLLVSIKNNYTHSDSFTIIDEFDGEYGLIIVGAMRYCFRGKKEETGYLYDHLKDNYEAIDDHSYGVLERDSWNYINTDDWDFYLQGEDKNIQEWIKIYDVLNKEFQKRHLEPWNDYERTKINNNK